MRTIKNYIWFIRESRKFMKGYNPVYVFVFSLFNGIGYCNNMNKWNKLSKKYGSEVAYCMIDRMI